MAGIFCANSGRSPLPAIQVVQNVYSDLGLSQALERDGSIWTRTVPQDLGITHDYSDFYGESVTTTISLVSTPDPDSLLNLSASNTFALTQVITVAGGRIESGGGDTTNTFTITYDSGGPSASQGMAVYIDSSDGEAKLATSDDAADLAEVAGFLTEDVAAGASTTIQTEGEISRDNWTVVAGTTTLTPGAMYYLDIDGTITVTPPLTGYIVIVGRAISSTKLDAELNPPWVL